MIYTIQTINRQVFDNNLNKSKQKNQFLQENKNKVNVGQKKILNK